MKHSGGTCVTECMAPKKCSNCAGSQGMAQRTLKTLIIRRAPCVGRQQRYLITGVIEHKAYRWGMLVVILLSMVFLLLDYDGVCPCPVHTGHSRVPLQRS